MINGTQHSTPFNTADESAEDSIWTLFSYAGIYVMAIGLQQDWEYFAVISFGIDRPD